MFVFREALLGLVLVCAFLGKKIVHHLHLFKWDHVLVCVMLVVPVKKHEESQEQQFVVRQSSVVQPCAGAL